MSRAVISVATAALLVGCGTSTDDPNVAMRDSAGVRIAESGGSDHPLPFTFTELRRFGGADSGAASFTDASQSLVHTDGRDRIYVLDRDRSVIAAFDSTGKPVAVFGRNGGGPGEFGMAFALIDAGPDEVAVFDFNKQALVRWSPDGAVLPELRLPTGLAAWRTFIRRGDTTYLALMDADSIRTLHSVTMATPADTVVLDSMIAPPRRLASFACFSAMLDPMFTNRFAIQMQGDRLLVARTDRYLVDVYRAGRLVASLRRPAEAPASTPDDARRMYPDGWKVTFGGGGGCTIDGAEVAAKAGMADRLPLIADLGFGPDSTIWVRRHTFPGDPQVSDVFAASGAYLGTITGRGLPLGWLGRDRILFPIEDDATGVTMIGIFSVSPATGEGAAGS